GRGGAGAPSLERRPVDVTDDLDLIEVIHAGRAERTVAGRKARGLDDVRLEAEARGKTKNRARVLGNVGLEQRNAHGPSFRACSEPRSRPKRKTSKRFVRHLIVATRTRTCPLALAWQGGQWSAAGLRRLAPCWQEGSGRFARRRQAASPCRAPEKPRRS